MKKVTVVLMMCLFLNSLSPFTATAWANDLKPNEVGAMGAVLMDANTGRVLWGKNEHTPLPMASTTKIMTAVVALEKGNMEDTVTVSKRASAAPEVKMGLRAGEEIQLKYLMYALMLQSSNDAAVAIAEHVGGSVENFCKMMTERAAEMGAKDTVFETPNGLDSANHHSTAYDMALITRYALQNKEFVDLINTSDIIAKSKDRSFGVVNKNRFLREFEGANGVKTGFTGKAGHCFVGSAKRGDMQLITVVLASGWGDKGKEQKWIDTKTIMKYGFDQFEYQNLLTKDAKAQDIVIERSKTDKVGTRYAEGFVWPLRNAERSDVYIEIDVPSVQRAPIMADEVVGKARVYVCGDMVKEVDILANDTAIRHDLKTSLEKVGNVWLEMGTNNTVNLVLPEF